MKFLFVFLLSMIWSSTALGYNPSQPEAELRILKKADELLLKGELAASSELMRGLIADFEQDRLMTGLTKMAVIYLELEKPHKARVYISELQVKLLGTKLAPHFTLKLAASYLQAGQLSAASSTLDQLLNQTPLYKDSIAEDVKMIQAFIDLEQINKATRSMILLDRKIKELKSPQHWKNTAEAVTN